MRTKSHSPLCRILPWDSEFFGFPIATVRGSALNQKSLPLIFSWCQKQKIRCLYFMSPAEDFVSIRLAEQARFKLVDIKTCMVTTLAGETSRKFNLKLPGVRKYHSDDRLTITQIARTIFSKTRFHFDGQFPRDRVNQMYEVWAEKCCQDPNAQIFVSTNGKPITGFVACQVETKGNGRIPLIGIRPEFQGRGIGTELLKSALHFFSMEKVKKVEVVTQGNNVPAVRSYEKAGFYLDSVRLCYHKWFLKKSDYVLSKE